MKYPADFATREEYLIWQKTGKMPEHQYLNYLKVEPINENGFLFKAILDYRHVSLYSLDAGYWEYLDKSDLRNIAPFRDFREKKQVFYITFGQSFYEVRDIQPS